MPLLTLLDYAGVAVFAATGALAASRKELDIIGFLFLASVTGIGGGTFRDLILGVPVFWGSDSRHVLICAAGLAACSVIGAAKGLAVTGSPTVSIVMGMLTAAFGGILRDLLAGEPSVLLRPEVYVTAALGGSAVYTLAALSGLPLPLCSAAGFVTAFAVRGGALRYGWCFPAYKGRPGRRPEDIP